jgi:hypothetical protein
MSHDERSCGFNCRDDGGDRTGDVQAESSNDSASLEQQPDPMNYGVACVIREGDMGTRATDHERPRTSEAFPTETCDACLEGARFGDSFVKSPHTCRKNTEYYCGHSAQDYEIRNGSLTCTECGPRSSEATPAPEKRGIDGESYTVRRFVLDHCAALGAEYEEDFRKDLLRMLAEVRAFEREACAQLFLGGGTYAGTDAAELIRSAKGGV